MYISTNEWKTTKETSNGWYIRNKKKKGRKRSLEYPTLKSGGERVSVSSQEYE